jgi:hypothetical protein
MAIQYIRWQKSPARCEKVQCREVFYQKFPDNGSAGAMGYSSALSGGKAT